MSSPVELKIPAVGESITEVVIGKWRKSPGDAVERDEVIVELETDKATFDLPAPAAGVLGDVLKHDGDSAEIGEVIARINVGQTAGAAPAPEKKAPPKQEQSVAESQKAPPKSEQPAAPRSAVSTDDGAADSRKSVKASAPSNHVGETRTLAAVVSPVSAAGDEEVIRMSPIRRQIARRLVEAQQTAALLTTFNEIDMSAVVELRRKYRDSFQTAHGVKLGMMSFFVKAVVEALSIIPQLNAEIRGENIVFHKRYDIGIAVGGGKGLVVPVLRNADRLNFAQIERSITDFGRRAKEGQIKLEELRGGTFTISNGGVYGSLLSTPIVNPPQSGVLGMHAIQDRPVVRNGEIVIRPMMYVALTYDHRIVDGAEAVTFLRRICEFVEDPSRLLIEI
jgi:2-oxoglutarate dehydrogenase E2 component (dihydrolipoamide succinyltransferase)